MKSGFLTRLCNFLFPEGPFIREELAPIERELLRLVRQSEPRAFLTRREDFNYDLYIALSDGDHPMARFYIAEMMEDHDRNGKDAVLTARQLYNRLGLPALQAPAPR